MPAPKMAVLEALKCEYWPSSRIMQLGRVEQVGLVMIGAPCSAWLGMASLSVATLGETVKPYTWLATSPSVVTVTVW